MNVIVSNKYKTMLTSLDIDVIKSISGEYEVGELISQFNNFFFNKMVLDITAIKNYQNINNIRELSVNMDMNKVVLLLDDSEMVNSPAFLSQLVSMGIYNFTRNIDAIKFLIDNPNTYKDVASYQTITTPTITNSDNKDAKEKIVYVETPSFNELRVIGIKNVTSHAGSTTLTYMLKKQLQNHYNVLAIEVDSNDFSYLNDKSLKSTSAIELPALIAMNKNFDIILVDLGDKGPISSCSEVIYLIEPGLIKLNKLIKQDRNVFNRLKDKKIVLNKSVLNEKDVSDFEYESQSKVFFNIPYLDDKLDNNKKLNELLLGLGFARISSDGEDNSKLFNIFK